MPQATGRGRQDSYAALALLSGLAVLMVCARIAYAGHPYFLFLAWNLLLAWLPLGFALLLERAWETRRAVQAWASGFLWLIFFPNAPYILTDLVHLRTLPPVPLWYDLLMLVASAVAGLLVGFASLAVVQRVVAEAVGPTAGWLMASAALVLASFGIYVGRFLRWNSWDVLVRPHTLLSDVVSSTLAAQWRVPVVTMLLSVILILSYLAMIHLPALGRERAR